MPATAEPNFYCNQKFWWLTVNLEKLHISSCCASDPQKVDLFWIEKNPGQIFNNPDLQIERKLMLENKPVSSCQISCWQPESKNLPSRRIIMFGDQPSHTEIDSDPETLNIILGSDCNLTCVYCCKNYSTAWTRDVSQKTYPVNISDDRFTINNTDKIIAHLSQKDLIKSGKRNKLLDEVINQCHSTKLKKIIITGGEPFLYSDLERLLIDIPTHIAIEIWSGLGVNETRFLKKINKLPSNVTISISAENIKKNYEFVRYGNTWERFLNNIKTLELAQINYKFASTVSNLTIFGILDFIQFADKKHIVFIPCVDPDFLSVNVLDYESKKIIKDNIERFPDLVATTIDIEPTEKQIYNLKNYIKEFSQRRNLDLSIFPKSFKNWILE